MLNLLIKALATWRISHMLVNEDGPEEIFKSIRKQFGFEYDINGALILYPTGNVLSCIYCTSVWVAAIVSFLPIRIVQVFAVSALAVMYNNIINSKTTIVVNNTIGK